MHKMAVSWETKLNETPHIGNKLRLPTLTGISDFTITELDGDRGIIESGDCIGRIEKKDGEWVYPHGLVDRNVMGTVIVAEDSSTSSHVDP